ncbi:Arc family DNA binding domain-containing protein [Bacteroidia bacterium]|nr:Arc family DNA binding domain-containing protein [Bacteroidia bacterium]GHV71608.1 Arc family DNA binding domain-containing protein [Bacteroidia bacterium]
MPKETENKNKSFVLRIDTETMNAIEKWASDEFRSVNGQIAYLLNQSLKKNGRLPEEKRKRTK